MISSLAILNFLSHKDTSLEFSPGVNIIVGPTDSGKSAVIKALKWLIFNRPMGDGMRSSWGGDTRVLVRVVPVLKMHEGDLITIERRKETTSNGYFLDEQRFNALKGEVPIEIANILNLSDINLQTQFDSHFLLSNSSGEVAQYFNKVAHLDKIDVGLQNINKWTRELSKKLEYNEQSCETSQERLIQYSSLNEIEGQLLTLEKKDNDRLNLIRDRSSITNLVTAIEVVERDLEEMSYLKELENTVKAILEIINKQKNLKNQIASLTMILTSIIEMGYEVVEVKNELTKLEKQFHEALGKGSVCPLCGSVI